MALPALAQAAKNVVTIAAKDPRVVGAVNKYVEKATNGRFSNVTSFSNGTTPTNQAIAVAAARAAGIPASDIWAGIDTARLTVAERKIFESTLEAHNATQQVLDNRFAINVQRNFAQDIQDKAMIQWAVAHFGSVQGMRRAHALLRSFMATDSDDLEGLVKVHIGR